jgi:hypothetical protein
MTDRSTITFTDNGELQQYEQTAANRAAQKLASITSDISSSSPSSDAIHIRDATLPDDLDEWADGPGETLYASYDSPSFELSSGASAAEDQDNSLFAFDADGNIEDKAAVLYGFQFPEPDDATTCPLTQVVIETQNSTIGQLDLTSIDMAEDGTVLIENPLIVGKEDRFVSAYAEEVPSSEEFKPLIKVAEPAGETISSSGSFADSGV